MDKKSPLKQRSALGRGLSALLSDADTPETTTTNPLGSLHFAEIKVESIETNPYQPRTDFDQTQLEELAESIRLHGIIQPITVRRLQEGVYQLISGERRLQASKLVNLEKIPAFIRTANDQEMLEMALIENIQRQDLNPIEIAFSYQRLISECHLKQEELGDRVGKKRATITNYLRLLKLPPDIQVALRDGSFSMGHARALISVENTDLQLSLFKKAITEAWSVRQIEEAVRLLTQKKMEKSNVLPAKREENFAILHVQQKLSSFLGTQVKIKQTGNEKGEISIPYTSTEDLNRILEILNV